MSVEVYSVADAVGLVIIKVHIGHKVVIFK